MSTDKQQYSVENQEATIAAYALVRGLQIVRRYADEAKSGLTLRDRPGLQALLEDVQGRRADFDVLLVYDVSRWGRFQDIDESAYYEHACRRAGVEVAYCAEPFENDGTLFAAMIKTLKRGMAAEYSRDLSKRVLGGQDRLIQKGFRQGGVAGYGLRRKLIDDRGDAKFILAAGQRKSIQTDRVVLVPGPEDEVAVVCEIYQRFLDGVNERQIADLLNARGLATHYGTRWQRDTVHQILTNPKYAGHNVRNRSSGTLGRIIRTRNPPDQWVRRDGAFEAVVAQETFDRVQQKMAARRAGPTDEDYLAKLRSLLDEVGTLNAPLIDASPGSPGSGVYQRRFGGLRRAYALIGFHETMGIGHGEVSRRLGRLRSVVSRQIISHFEQQGMKAETHRVTGVVVTSSGLTISAIVGRRLTNFRGNTIWSFTLPKALRADVVVALKMDDANVAPVDYVLLRAAELQREKFNLSQSHRERLEHFPFQRISELREQIAQRTPIARSIDVDR